MAAAANTYMPKKAADEAFGLRLHRSKSVANMTQAIDAIKNASAAIPKMI